MFFRFIMYTKNSFYYLFILINLGYLCLYYVSEMNYQKIITELERNGLINYYTTIK